MNELLQQVDTLKEELRTLRPLSKAELQRLREEFVIETTYNSNAIEGNTLTLRETALILQEGIAIAEKPLRDHLDIIGFKDAFYYYKIKNLGGAINTAGNTRPIICSRPTDSTMSCCESIFR